MKNIITVYKEFKNISKIADAITEIGENIFLTTSIKNGLQFLNFERAELFIIDSSYDISEEEFEALKKVDSELIFMSENDDELQFNLHSIGTVVTHGEMIDYISHSPKDIGANISAIKKKKIPNVFRDFESFKNSITQEVRRAKRYQYPLVVVMFKLTETHHIEQVINYFASKIREFDSLWITDDERFAMVLPHTGWNGAEILTNRLTTHITGELKIDISSLKNKIISFKRIETDADFISKIEFGLDSEYYDVNRDIDFNVWKEELFSEFLEGKTIRIFNRYKGMLISHDSDIILKNSKLELHNIRPLQLSIINDEKATYFYSTTLSKTVRAGVEKLDLRKAFATLTSFEIIDSSFIKNTTMKLLVEEDITVKISTDSNHIDSKLVELSLDEMTIMTHTTDIFKESSHCDIEFSLDLKKGGNYIIKTEAKVKEIEEGREISYIDLEITTSLNDNMKISEYLSGKQIKFIKELKGEEE